MQKQWILSIETRINRVQTNLNTQNIWNRTSTRVVRMTTVAVPHRMPTQLGDVVRLYIQITDMELPTTALFYLQKVVSSTYGGNLNMTNDSTQISCISK